MSDAARILAPIAEHFAESLALYGATPPGVLWRNVEGQRLRFEQLVKIFDPADLNGGVVVNELGCGYGAMFDYLRDLPAFVGGRYWGYDISAEMLAAAQTRIKDPRAGFMRSHRVLHAADYALISGTYNLLLDTDEDQWLDYVRSSLVDSWAMCRKGLAFNMLRPDRSKAPLATLYYTDPQPFLEFCRRRLAPDVTIVEGYPLAEWTMLIRR